MRTASTAGELLSTNKKKQIIAIIGCGGKTTFMNNLGLELGKEKKVLITTTTKILPPDCEEITLCTTLEECENHRPTVGVQCFGILNVNTGKLESLSPEILEEITSDYEVVLIEADGSAGLPLKGWAKTEPVIPNYCTHTFGIVTTEEIGKLVDENTVFRIPEFSKVTGLVSGDCVDFAALEKMVMANNGMFWNSVGEKSLWVNKVESPEQREVVVKWLTDIRRKYPDFFQFTTYGSARQNLWERVV